MEALHQRFAINTTDLSLVSLINFLALLYLTQFNSVCVIRNKDELLHHDVPIPTITITVDEDFNSNFRSGIDSGCQAFIVYGQALWPFLDSLIPIHDAADQRFSGKKLITVLDFGDFTSSDVLKHSALKDIPDILIVTHQNDYRDIELFTTHFFSDGSRGSSLVDVRKIVPPNYFPDKSTNLNGIPIRYRALMYPPFTYHEETTPDRANARYDERYSAEDVPVFLDGHETLVLVEFCQRHNCSVETFPDDDWGAVTENGTGTGAIGSVATREADFTVGAIYYWVEPYKFLTYSVPLSRSGVTVVVPKPKTLAPWRTPFLSFSGHLWIAVAISFAVGACSVWLIDKFRHQIVNPHNEHPKTISDAVLTIIGFFMEQATNTRNDLLACVFLYTSLIFAGFMVGNLYGAGLASIMTIPQYESSINTPMDLADSGMLWGSELISWINSITSSNEPYLKTLVNNYRVLDLEHLRKHTKTRDFGFVGERSEFGHFGPTDFLDQESSHMLRLLTVDVLWQSCAAYVSKTCPFKPQLNDLIMNIRQSGIQYYWELRAVNRYLDVSLQLNVLSGRKSSTEGEAETLTVSHFLGAFLILALGYVTGMVLFVLELLVWKFARKKQL